MKHTSCASLTGSAHLRRTYACTSARLRTQGRHGCSSWGSHSRDSAVWKSPTQIFMCMHCQDNACLWRGRECARCYPVDRACQCGHTTMHTMFHSEQYSTCTTTTCVMSCQNCIRKWLCSSPAVYGFAGSCLLPRACRHGYALVVTVSLHAYQTQQLQLLLT